MSGIEWRERLLERMPEDLAEEIDIFEGQMELRRKGKIEDRVFAETRDAEPVASDALVLETAAGGSVPAAGAATAR